MCRCRRFTLMSFGSALHADKHAPQSLPRKMLVISQSHEETRSSSRDQVPTGGILSDRSLSTPWQLRRWVNASVSIASSRRCDVDSHRHRANELENDLCVDVFSAASGWAHECPKAGMPASQKRVKGALRFSAVCTGWWDNACTTHRSATHRSRPRGRVPLYVRP
jgi:hypothetical protein